MTASRSDEVSDEDFQEILAQTRHFVRTAVVPREQEILADDKVPDDLRDQAKKMGLFGYAIPQEWGGLGLNLAQDVETRDGAGLHLAGAAVDVRHQQRHRRPGAGRVRHRRAEGSTWLERIASGDVVASFALTEPGAGSNPVGVAHQGRSRRRSSGSSTGDKRFITNAPTADLFVVVRTHPARRRRRPRHRGVPGARRRRRASQVGAKDAKMGQEGAWTADVSFTDVRVPDSRTGRRQRGHRLPGGDDLAGAGPRAHRGAGGRHRAARARRIRGLRRDRHPGRHADRRLPTGAGHARRPADRRAGRARAGPRHRAGSGSPDEDRRIAPSAAKLFCTEMAGKVADLAVQIHGGSGYMREVPVERIYRDVRLLRLYEGTSEIQRLIIGGESRQGRAAAAR